MKNRILVFLVIVFSVHFGWSQKPSILTEFKQKVEAFANKLEAFECNELDPLSLNAGIVWSDDKTQLAIVMKANLLHGWHIYAYVPKTQPYITTELELELPKGISTIGKWITPLDEAYNGGVYIYHGELVFIQYCSANNYNMDEVIKCGLYYQTCDLNKCYPPETKTRTLEL